MPEDNNILNITEKIKKNYKDMSKSYKLIADYLVKNYEKAAFMTAAKLGEKVGVSEATVVRFANYLGYDGYPMFKKVLQDMIKSKLTTIERIDMVIDKLDKKNLVEDVLNADIENIRYTLDEFDESIFEKVVDTIVKAKTVYIVGFRTTSILTQYLGYYLDLLLENVKVIDYGVGDVYEKIIGAKASDIVIGVSFPRYSLKTYETIEYLKKKGLKIIAITDNKMSPITKESDYCLIAKSNIISFVDTITAPLSLINALIVAIGLKNKSKTKAVFYELEEIWAKHDIYDHEEPKNQID